MAWTQADLDAVDTALKNGIRKVTFADGRSREYQTTSEMLALRNQMKSELLASSSQVAPRRVTVARIRRSL
jgi:hypothetical protein